MNNTLVAGNPVRAGGPTMKAYDDVVCFVDAMYDRLSSTLQPTFDADIRQPIKVQLKAALEAAIKACDKCAGDDDWSACWVKTRDVQCLALEIAKKLIAWGQANASVSGCGSDAQKLWGLLSAFERTLIREANDVIGRTPEWQKKMSEGGGSMTPWLIAGGVGIGLLLLWSMIGGKRRR